MKFIKVLAISIIPALSSTVSSNTSSAFQNNLDFLLQVTPITSISTEKEVTFDLKKRSEIELLSTGLIRVYQLFISSQDLPVCNFTQSCSRFGMEAIQRYGLFWGGLITADKIMRCNSLTRGHYKIDKETGLAIDHPVERYYLFSP